MPVAESTIYTQLEQHGLHWDERPYRQSEHLEEYTHAIDLLKKTKNVFYCRCTRAQLKGQNNPHTEEPVYIGTCRNLALDSHESALRMRVPDQILTFDDQVLGSLRAHMAKDVGDIVLQRKDGLIAYQLACAIDESAMGITHVVRGADLISSTFRQIELMDALGLSVPAYAHLPLKLDENGRKLSKQNHAGPLKPSHASQNISEALKFLNQPLPEDSRAPVEELLAQAISQWSLDSVTKASHPFSDR